MTNEERIEQLEEEVKAAKRLAIDVMNVLLTQIGFLTSALTREIKERREAYHD